MKYLTCDGTVNQRDEVRGTYFQEGSVLLTPDEAQHLAMNVLPVYRDHMRTNADELRNTAQAIRSNPAPHVVTPGHIDVTPNPTGLDRLATVFDEYVERASAQIVELQGPEDE